MTEPARAFSDASFVREEGAVDDRPLLERLRDGDDSALAELHQRHAQAVYWVARNQLGSVPDAEEITQDAFLLLWRKCRRIDLVGSSCLPWLLVTVNYLALNGTPDWTRTSDKRLRSPLTPLSERLPTSVIRAVHSRTRRQMLGCVAVKHCRQTVSSADVLEDLLAVRNACRNALTEQLRRRSFPLNLIPTTDTLEAA